ncbi:MAG TPA: PIN domain-containing protein [Gemmataceae bacterium]|nr:PIN domain-containing protein [Gemmataceae bacterium]
MLDASALLAMLRKEPGREVVEPVVIGATMSAVNYSEVIKKAVEAGGNAAETRGWLRLMDLVVVAFDKMWSPMLATEGIAALTLRRQRAGFLDNFSHALEVVDGQMRHGLRFVIHS